MSLLLVALMMSADPTAAQAPPASAPAVVAEKVKEQKICRVDDQDSVSRLRRRVCMTQTEWDRKAGGQSANDLKNLGAR